MLQILILPHETLLEVMTYLPTRELCKLMILSKYFNQAIKEIIIDRFTKVFSGQNQHILVYMSRYDLLELTQTYHAFDFAFKSFNGDTLITIFSIDSTQPKGTIGSRGKKLEGLTLRGGSICRQKLINDSIQYLGWGLKSEEKNARIYVYDSSSMNNPCLKAYYVTHGKVITPLDGCKATKGWWSTLLYSKKKKKSVTTVGFVGRNKTSGKLPGIPYVAGKLKNISIKADFLLVAYEEKKVDKSKNGIKYLLTEGGEEYLKRKKTCVIS